MPKKPGRGGRPASASGGGDRGGKAARASSSPPPGPSGGRAGGRGAARAGRPASGPPPPAKAKATGQARSPAQPPPAKKAGANGTHPPSPPASLFSAVVSAAARAKRELAALGGEAVASALGLAAPRARRAAATAALDGIRNGDAVADAAVGFATAPPSPPPPPPPVPPLLPIPTWGAVVPRRTGGGGSGRPSPRQAAAPAFPTGRRSPRGRHPHPPPVQQQQRPPPPASRGGRRGGGASVSGAAAPSAPGGAFALSPLRPSVRLGSAAAAAAALAAATAGVAAVEAAGLVAPAARLANDGPDRLTAAANAHASACSMCGVGAGAGGRGGGGASTSAPTGALVGCAGCTAAAHPACVGLTAAQLTGRDWLCGACVEAGVVPGGGPPRPLSGTGRPLRAAAAAATAAVAATMAPARVHMAAPAVDSQAGAAALRAARNSRASSKHGRLFVAGVPGALRDGQALQYRTSSGTVLLSGSAVVPPATAPAGTPAGIRCGHCGDVVSASVFEAHAGRGARRAPYENTVTADGGQSLRALAAALPPAEAGEGAGHYPPGGSMDGGGGGGVARAGAAAPASAPVPPDLIPGGCVLCHRSDFQLDGFGPRTIIICDQCEREFHVDCLAASRRAHLSALPAGDWFCSPECHGIHGALRRVVAAGARDLRGSPHSIQVLRGRDGNRSTETALKAASDLLAEAFDPILDAKSGADLTRAMVAATALGDWDFTGMHTALLRHEGVAVCAAVFRVFGPQMAELPLIATRAAARRAGHARALVTAVERLLAQLGVASLSLPAAHETVDAWRHGFGFEPLDPDVLRTARSELRLLVFPGTEVLTKRLPRSAGGGPPLLVPPPTRARAAAGGGGGGPGRGASGRGAPPPGPPPPPAMIGGPSYATAGALDHLGGLPPAEAAAAAAVAGAVAEAGGGRRRAAAPPAPTPPGPRPARAAAPSPGRAAPTAAAAGKRRAAGDLPPRPGKKAPPRPAPAGPAISSRTRARSSGGR